MRTITLEEHFLADGFRERIERAQGRELSKGPFAERYAKLSGLGSTRLKDMDAGAVDLQVISHTAEGGRNLSRKEDVELARAANDQLAAAIAAHPDRFAGLAILPLTDPEAAVDELERAIRTLGFKGIMVNGTTNGLFLDDPSFLPVLERAVALDVPIYVHPAEPPEAVQKAYYSGFEGQVNFVLSTAGWGWHSETAIHSLRMILAGVFDRLPTLQIIIGHMGEMIPFMLARINDTLTPATGYLQRPIPDYLLQNFTITTSGFFTDPPLLLALQTFGADRIMYAVDYPYSTNERGRAFLDSASISPLDKEKISHLNAERLLKLAKA
ncbi:MAG: amidohydrolase [Ktedonobacteraceae bacterium]|nr:amidohydrolase [Ktedonobacteraceae bacterium]